MVPGVGHRFETPRDWPIRIAANSKTVRHLQNPLSTLKLRHTLLIAPLIGTGR